MSNKAVWLYENRINTRELVDVLKLGKEINKPVCILGPSGVGKTEIVEQFAEKEYKGVCHTIILNHFDVCDLVGQGIPFIEDGKVYMKLSESALIPMDEDFVGVLHLDEVTNVNTQMGQVLYQLVNERKCGGRSLPKGMQVVLSGNRVWDGGASQDLLGPLANRLIIVELEPHASHWLEDYADKVGIHPAVYQYVYDNNDKLYEYGTKDDCPSFSSGRSMKTASDVFHKLEAGVINQKIASCAVDGVLGNDKFLQIYPIYESCVKLPKSIEILQGTNTKKLDNIGMAGIFSVLSSCMFHLTQSIKENKSCSVEYGKNLIRFMSDQLIEEKEILVSFINKLCKVGQEHNRPQFIMEIRKDNPSFVLLLKDNMEFEQQLDKLIEGNK